MSSLVDLADLNEWTYGEPDLIVQMKEGFRIPAEGADFYPSEIVDPGLTEDRYVQWVQIIPEAYCNCANCPWCWWRIRTIRPF